MQDLLSQAYKDLQSEEVFATIYSMFIIRAPYYTYCMRCITSPTTFSTCYTNGKF